MKDGTRITAWRRSLATKTIEGIAEKADSIYQDIGGSKEGGNQYCARRRDDQISTASKH